MTDDFRKQMVQEWCGGRVEVNRHYLPCDKLRGHSGVCDVDNKAWRDHIALPESRCIEAGCPAYADGEPSHFAAEEKR